jgi:hypothetical protein
MVLQFFLPALLQCAFHLYPSSPIEILNVKGPETCEAPTAIREVIKERSSIKKLAPSTLGLGNRELIFPWPYDC